MTANTKNVEPIADLTPEEAFDHNSAIELHPKDVLLMAIKRFEELEEKGEKIVGGIVCLLHKNSDGKIGYHYIPSGMNLIEAIGLIEQVKMDIREQCRQE